MKTNHLKAIVTVLAVLFFAKSYAQDDFVLKGRIGEWNAPAKLFLAYTVDDKQIVDSVTLDKGKFEFRGEVDFSSPAVLRLSPEGTPYDQPQYHYETSFILNKGTTELEGDGLESAKNNVKHRTKTEISFTLGKKEEDETETKYPRFYGGLTFSRIDWGFSRLINDGSFTLSEDNSFLSYKKASNFGFDVLQFGLRFNDNFKAYLSAGVEWNYLRLKENILLDQDATSLSHSVIDKDQVEYRKNVLTSTYMRTPITFEWRSAKIKNDDRVKVAFGLMTGVLLKGTQRLKSKADGKQKFKDNYNLASFQYGPFVRIGYDDLGIFAKYYVNDMFENSPAQKGLNNFAFGLTLGF